MLRNTVLSTAFLRVTYAKYAPLENARLPCLARVFKFCTLNHFNVVIPSEVEESGKSA